MFTTDKSHEDYNDAMIEIYKASKALTNNEFFELRDRFKANQYAIFSNPESDGYVFLNLTDDRYIKPNHRIDRLALALKKLGMKPSQWLALMPTDKSKIGWNDHRTTKLTAKPIRDNKPIGFQYSLAI